MKESTKSNGLKFLKGLLITAGIFAVFTALLLGAGTLFFPNSTLLSTWENAIQNYFSFFAIWWLFILIGAYLYMNKGMKSVIKLILWTAGITLVLFISVGSCMNSLPY
jgi:NhaP-type Na+/H+ or K+/H+ antiporter